MQTIDSMERWIAQTGNKAPRRAERTRTRRGRTHLSWFQWLIYGSIIGAAIVMVLWWVVDLAVFEGAGGMDWMNADHIRIALSGYLLGGLIGGVATWDWRRANRKKKSAPGEAATSTESLSNKPPQVYPARIGLSSREVR